MAFFCAISCKNSLPNKDFGRGFYLTPSKHDATKRAKDKCSKEHWGVPTILEYKWDDYFCTQDAINQLQRI